MLAYAEWIVLAIGGLALAWSLNLPFFVSAAWLWVMGLVYNVPPVRTKEWAYLDVLTEAINNPIRLFLGWFALIPDRVPPLSLTLSYWMAGAFFMAMKRYAEYRHIANAEVAASYRRPFRHYNEHRRQRRPSLDAGRPRVMQQTAGISLPAQVSRYGADPDRRANSACLPEVPFSFPISRAAFVQWHHEARPRPIELHHRRVRRELRPHRGCRPQGAGRRRRPAAPVGAGDDGISAA